MKKITFYLFGLLFLLPSISLAEHKHQANDNFQINLAISDGKDGRTYLQWRQRIEERPVLKVTARVRKTSGGSDTYINLRYASGKTFESGRRVTLKDGTPQTIVWNVNGMAPRGREIVMNAYKGEVLLEKVTVVYQKQAPKPRPLPTINHGHQNHGLQEGGTRYDEEVVVSKCRRIRIRRPRIEVGRARPSGGLFSGKHRISGSVSGNCIEEAGYYEYGQLRQELPITFSNRFQRKNFSYQVRGGRDGEIRAYTSDGKESIIEVDRVINSR